MKHILRKIYALAAWITSNYRDPREDHAWMEVGDRLNSARPQHIQSKTIDLAHGLKRLQANLNLQYLLIVILICSLSSPALSCSVMALDEHIRPVVAANYDWSARGGIVFESPRGQVKSPTRFFDNGVTAQWVSRFASLTVSQFGRDFPMQGINEAGLMGVVLVSPAQYPSVGRQGVLTESYWLQYQLDRFSTVAEVAEHADDFAIEKVSADLHWFLCDATGACIVVEYTKGERIVFTGENLPIRALTNSPYANSLQIFLQWQESRGPDDPLPSGYGSYHRFIRLAASRATTRIDALLKSVNDTSLEGFTAFQTLFDLESKRIQVRLPDGPWREASFSERSLDCHQNLGMLNLSEGSWVPYNQWQVAELFERATVGADDLGPERRKRILQNSENIRCQDGKAESETSTISQ